MIEAKQSPEQIVKILSSFKKLGLNCSGNLEVWQYDDKFSASIHSFIYTSATQKILSYTEDFLNDHEEVQPNVIIEVFSSIRKLQINDNILDVWFKDSAEVFSCNEFVYGSFTNGLLLVIEEYLNE